MSGEMHRVVYVLSITIDIVTLKSALYQRGVLSRLFVGNYDLPSHFLEAMRIRVERHWGAKV